MELIHIEVAYALPDAQYLLTQKVSVGTTASEAVAQCQFPSHLDSQSFKHAPMGIYGQVFGRGGLATAEDYILKEGDRIEIYRPLRR